jgi:integrase
MDSPGVYGALGISAAGNIPGSRSHSATWTDFRHTYRSLLDETYTPIGVQQELMPHSNMAATTNVYGNASIKAKQQANSKVVQMVMRQDEPQSIAV